MNKHVLKIQKELEEAKEKLARQHKRVSLVSVGKCSKKVYEKLLRIFEVHYCDGNLLFLRADYAELFVDAEEEEGPGGLVLCCYAAW